MDRDDILLMGHGGAGNKITDMIMRVNPLFEGFFVNSSKTDMKNLKKFNSKTKNYICTSLNNGTGRDRETGKIFAQDKLALMVKTILEYDQSTIFIIFSLGGGSGSSSASILLRAIDNLKNDGQFNKTVNIIGILPDLNSPSIILKNARETWNEIMTYKCINNMLFIDNNNMINGRTLKEDEINKNFAILFDKIFSIPDVNGTKFDNGNLGNIINSHGYSFIYDLPSGCENIDQAIEMADKNSILAKIYTADKEMIKIDDKGNKKIRCGYLGISINDKNYKIEDFLRKYEFNEENYYGYNEDDNLLILTGLLPPYLSIQLINEELTDRLKKSNKKDTDFEKFTTPINSDNKTVISNIKTDITKGERADEDISVNKKMKKIMKKNLLDIL
ncbi:hypothetical protein ACFHWD_03880 [Clostridium sp. MT-14]|uniref:hypothetical protein n=1 Tax=Clostridium sp. MT-14 TaxID=3348360 RepID=UPI0035F3EDA7